MNLDIVVSIIGWIGTGCIVTAFFLHEMKKLDATKSQFYQLLNIFGALGIGVNVFVHQAWPAFALQCLWGVIAFVALMRMFRNPVLK